MLAGSGTRACIRSRIGAEEITCMAVKTWLSPQTFLALMVQVLRYLSQTRLSSLQPIWIVPPCSWVLKAAASHIIPGPLRGYSKLSIRVLITLPPSALPRVELLERRNELAIALQRSRPLMRCA